MNNTQEREDIRLEKLITEEYDTIIEDVCEIGLILGKEKDGYHPHIEAIAMGFLMKADLNEVVKNILLIEAEERADNIVSGE